MHGPRVAQSPRFVKVRAHRGEPLNEAADALASAAAESDPSRPVVLDLEAEAVHFSYRGIWVEHDARVREELVQREAIKYVSNVFRSKRGRVGQEDSPLTQMRISTAKQQVLQSLASAFPCNAVLRKWRIVHSATCALCGHPA